MDKILGREVLEIQDLPYEDVPVPAWGGTVRIAGLSADAAIDFSNTILNIDRPEEHKEKNIMTELLSRTIVDEQLNPLFTKEELGKKNVLTIRRLFRVAERLSGLNENSQEEAQKN